MATSAPLRLLTAEEFLRIDFGPDVKAELDVGVIRMMAGGTREHARVQTNILGYLRQRLRGSGCRPYGSDMAVRTRDQSVRYPDVTVDCGAPGDQPDDLVLSDPRVVIEVLSPSTSAHDLSVKKNEYCALDTVRTVAFVDPDTGGIKLCQRIEDGWTESFFSETADLEVPSLSLTIPRAEVFAQD